MRVPKVVRNQNVNRGKLELAKELRRSMTAEESVLWERLRGNRLNGLHFRRQQVIEGFIVDFYCHDGALVVEVDGAVHDGQVEEDRARDEVFRGLGLKVLRVRNEEVAQDVEGVLKKITEAIDVSG